MNKITILGIFVFLAFSCNFGGEKKQQANFEKSITETNKLLLAGSWKDTSKSALHFTLFKDGTARSDNMKTLLYKNWEVNENEITFTTESIGNKISFTTNETYTIIKITETRLILKKDDTVFEYVKEHSN